MSLAQKVNLLTERLDDISTFRVYGKVSQVLGLLIESTGPTAAIGDICKIYPRMQAEPALAEVVGFRDDRVLCMPLGEIRGVSPGSDVVATGESFRIRASDNLLGRVLNGLGEPLDNQGPILGGEWISASQQPPHPLQRQRIMHPVSTGIKAIDGMTTLGLGQRMGIFAGSGVGKSTLLGMISRNTSADVNVIALIGERGREVREFIEKDLGETGLARSVLVVATSDQPALVRIKASLVATAIAEFFRDQGKNVMLMMDSVTRVAMALREVGLTIGEPPTTRGYTPSVFAFFPQLLERAGTASRGSITGLYSVLVEGDDLNEPVADMVRGILDGHIVLSRKLAAGGHYPAIDVLDSISRVMPDVVVSEQMTTQQKFTEIISTYREAEDLINIGAYVKGSNARIDYAVQKMAAVNGFLTQTVDEPASLEESVAAMQEILV